MSSMHRISAVGEIKRGYILSDSFKSITFLCIKLLRSIVTQITCNNGRCHETIEMLFMIEKWSLLMNFQNFDGVCEFEYVCDEK